MRWWRMWTYSLVQVKYSSISDDRWFPCGGGRGRGGHWFHSHDTGQKWAKDYALYMSSVGEMYTMFISPLAKLCVIWYSFVLKKKKWINKKSTECLQLSKCFATLRVMHLCLFFSIVILGCDWAVVDLWHSWSLPVSQNEYPLPGNVGFFRGSSLRIFNEEKRRVARFSRKETIRSYKRTDERKFKLEPF